MNRPITSVSSIEIRIATEGSSSGWFALLSWVKISYSRKITEAATKPRRTSTPTPRRIFFPLLVCLLLARGFMPAMVFFSIRRAKIQ